MDMRLRLFVSFREKVSSVLKAKFKEDSADYDAKRFDPLLIRKWFSMSPLHSKIGLCGLGTEFAWTEQQSEYLLQLWEEFNQLISVEAATHEQRKRNISNAVARTYSKFDFKTKLGDWDDDLCQPCGPEAIEISSDFSGKVDVLQERLRKDADLTEDMVAEMETRLRQKQDFLEDRVAFDKFRIDLFDTTTQEGKNRIYVLIKMSRDAAEEKKLAEDTEIKKTEREKVEGAVDLQAMQERIFEDLVRLNDHLHILLPDLCRRFCDAKEGGPYADKVKIMERVAPHISKQYRAEQTDLTLLENMRRLRFEREKLATQLVDELLKGEEDQEAGGYKLAKCPPGCIC
jgi:hypothetical protein